MPICRRTPLIAFSSWLLFLGSAVALAQTTAAVQPDRYLEHVKYLASPELEGRGAGTEGLDRAAQYIESRFKQFGLEPAGEGGSYRQSFNVTTGAKLGDNKATLISQSKSYRKSLIGTFTTRETASARNT